MQVSDLGHVLLLVDDPVDASEFYQRVLGLEELERNDKNWIFLGLPGRSHVLDLAPRQGDQAVSRSTWSSGPLGHVAFRVDSTDAFDAAYAHVVDCGVSVDRATDHSTQESFYFRDLDENVIEIYNEHPQARSMFLAGRDDADRELDMTTRNRKPTS